MIQVKVKRADKLECSFEIEDSATITDLDEKICEKFEYDEWDHCRAFFAGKPWRGDTIAEITPDGCEESQDVRIQTLAGLKKISYVYDFGGDIQHDIQLKH